MSDLDLIRKVYAVFLLCKKGQIDQQTVGSSPRRSCTHIALSQYVRFISAGKGALILPTGGKMRQQMALLYACGPGVAVPSTAT
jgi:hypothetical protein